MILAILHAIAFRISTQQHPAASLADSWKYRNLIDSSEHDLLIDHALTISCPVPEMGYCSVDRITRSPCPACPEGQPGPKPRA